MWKELKFAVYAFKKNIQSSAELRTSFLLNIIGMAINNSSFIILWIFFIQSVGVIGGWTPADIIGLLGFGALGFGVVFSVTAGIERLPDYVASGAFDRFMLSPKNLLLRVATSSFNASAIGDIVFGIACLTIYAFLIDATLYQISLIVLSAILAIVLFLGVAVTVFSLSFYFIDSHAVTQSIFEIFLTPSLFPGGAFQGVMRFVFTFFIPSLLVGTLPVEVVKDVSLSKLLLIAILAVVWLTLSIKVFHISIRKYESSNLMTFGS